MSRYISVLSFLILLSFAGFAQQDAQYSQYMFNGLVLNPAYAGSWENVSTTFILRRQWTGFEGSPSTESFSIHGPSRNLRNGFGFALSNDRLGLTKNFNVNFSYAYRILMGESSALSLGLLGSLNNYRSDFGGIIDPNSGQTDQVLEDATVNLWQPNVGTGIYLNTKSLYLGASVPHLLNNKLYDPNATGVNATQVRHVFLTGGLIFGGDAVKFKPSALVKMTPGAPVSLDINGSFLFADKLWLGASWRMQDAVVLMFDWRVTKAFRFGYAYDIGISELKTVHNGSHEFMLGFDFFFKGQPSVSPRYF